MEPTTSDRRHDLDWLRVLAFGLLIFFHAAIAFVPGGLPLMQNDQTSPVLIRFVQFLQEFRLGLLFLVSGFGVAFALRGRDRAAFFRERAARLLVPLAFGILVLVPPMVWLEKQHVGAYDGPLWGAWVGLFEGGVYPDHWLSWHHFWFVAYLFLFCLLGWPLFERLQRPAGAGWLTAAAGALCRGGRLYLGCVLLLIVELALRPLFPGFRDLIHDWASFTHWFVLFVWGFVIAREPRLLARIEQLRWPSLALALAATTVLFAQFSEPTRPSFTPFPAGAEIRWDRWLGFCLTRSVNAWCWLLVCLGFAARLLNRSSATLRYLNGAVYPLFCLHLTAMVVVESWVLAWPVGLWGRYLLVCAFMIAASLTGYELFRRVSWLRPLVGLRVHQQRRP